MSGSVTSEFGNTYVYSAGSVSGTVEAEADAFVEAGDSVTAPVSAGGADGGGLASVKAGDSVSAAVQAGWAQVDAGGDITGTISAALGYADVKAGGRLYGDVSAPEGWVWVLAFGGVEGDITGWSEVAVRSYAEIDGEIRSLDGPVDIWASGAVLRQVQGKLTVRIDADGDVVGDITAGDSLNLSGAVIQTAGSLIGNVWAAGDATVWADGDVLGDVRSMFGAADVSAVGDVQGDVWAGQSATLVTFSSLYGAVTAQAEVAIHALGVVEGTLTSNAGMVGGWVRGDLRGTVRAKTGVDILTQGNLTGAVTAGDETTAADAILVVGGSLSGPLQTSRAVTAVVGGDVTQAVQGGGDMFVSARGSITANITSGGAAVVEAGGTITGTVTAQGQQTVTANKDFSAVGPILYLPPPWVVMTIGQTAGQLPQPPAVSPGSHLVVVLYVHDPFDRNRYTIMNPDNSVSPIRVGPGQTIEGILRNRFPDVDGKVHWFVQGCGKTVNEWSAERHQAYKEAQRLEIAAAQRAKEEQKQAAEEEKRRQRTEQAQRDVQRMIDQKQIRLPARQELLPDASVRSVTQDQGREVRRLLDGPGGLGGQVFVPRGDVPIFVPNEHFNRPTPWEIDAAVSRRYLELAIQEEGIAEQALDALQLALDVGGLIPLIGEPLDGINAGISFGRGRVLEASLSLLAMVPVLGGAAGVSKIARRGLNAVELAAKDTKSAGRLTSPLRHLAGEAAVDTAVEQARLNLAASLKAGFVTEESVVESLRRLGRSEAAARTEARQLITEAQAAAGREGAQTAFESSRKFFAHAGLPGRILTNAEWAAKKAEIEALGIEVVRIADNQSAAFTLIEKNGALVPQIRLPGRVTDLAVAEELIHYQQALTMGYAQFDRVLADGPPLFFGLANHKEIDRIEQLLKALREHDAPGCKEVIDNTRKYIELELAAKQALKADEGLRAAYTAEEWARIQGRIDSAIRGLGNKVAALEQIRKRVRSD